MSTNYENQICEAIEYIVNHAIADAGFDKTIQATVVNCIDETIGQYKVKYQNSTFNAYSNSTEVSYLSGTEVYILVPQNDMSNTKTILGAVDKLGTDYVKTLEATNTHEIIGKNCVKTNDSFELCSYKEKDVKILYNSQENNNLIDLDVIGLEEYIKTASHLMCGGYFKTSLDKDQRFKGNYGIGFDLVFKNNNNETSVTRNYIVDIDQMTGSPYAFNNYTKQIGVFEVDGENFLYVDKIYLFSYDFPLTEENKPNDIFIKDIELSCVKAISDEALTSYHLSLLTPQGIYFDGTSSDEDVRTIQAQVRIQGKVVDNTIQKIDYYWFKENAKVDNVHNKYSKYGGRGWECLNDYNIIDGDLIDWISGEHEYNVGKADCLAKITNYKCVAVIGDAIIESMVAIKNFASNYDISIHSTNGTQFYYDRGNTDLICYVNNEEQLENYSYVWVENTNIGGYNQLTETTEINNEYKKIQDEYNQLLLDIADEKILAANAQEQIDNYLTKLKEYDTIMRVENNAIYGLKASGINNFSIYKCAVFYNETYIGTSAITLVNTLEVETGYNLIITNGNLTYQYNEDGISPTHKTLENPIEIKPLSFNIYDNLGVQLDEETLQNCQVQWILPKENTMIMPVDADYEETENNYIFKNKIELNYDLIPKYDISKNNNTVQLMVEYKGLSLVGATSLAFTKQGNPGTNGTEYTCRIVPNITEGTVDYPALVNGILNYTPEQDNIWFKVQLWKNTENIFEGSQSGTALEGGSVKVKWNILKNIYSRTIEDYSNIVLKDAATGEFQYTPCNWRNSPANIIECEVEHAGMSYYATLPIIVIEQQLEGYDISWVKDTGFSYAVYSADGIQPKYSDRKPFELKVTKIIDGVEEDITLLEKAEKLDYQWVINGTVYDLDENAWIDSLHLIENKSRLDEIQKNQFKVKPVETFGGHCVTNSITCIVVDTLTDETVGIITIPVYLCLNRYGLVALNGWNGNSVSINEDGGFILAPQVGAGKKEEDNSFTGIFMGVVKEKGTSVDETGLFAYKKGVRSIFLDAETGDAIFGTKEGSQFIITPATPLDPGDTKVIAIHDNVKNEDVFYVTKDGQLVVRGDGSGLDITANKTIENLDGSISDLDAKIEAVAGEIDISVTKDNIIQSINLSTEEGATINAAKINLKGAVTISDFDNELADKIDDIDNQIINVEVQYYSSTSKVQLIGGAWSAETPEWQEGRYIWSKNVYYYQDTTKTPGESKPVCITGNTGAAGSIGVGISEIIEWYQVSDKDSGIVAGEGTWYNEEIPKMDATNRYLWNYEEIKYTQGQPSSITPAMVIGVYGENGQDGEDGEDGQPGRGIKKITEYYLATSKNSGITLETSGWKTNIAEATLTAVNKYLWNYELIEYTDNTSTETTPVIIGVYGDKGEDGTGIVSVTNYYLKSDKKTGITIANNTWTTVIPTLDATNKYLWNYEETIYTKGDPSQTSPHVVSIYSEDGKGILSIKEMYAASTDNSQPSKSSFNETAPTLSSTNKYLWCYEIITYTKGDPTETEPHLIGVYGDDGKGIKETVIAYADSTNGTQWPTTESEWQSTIPTVAEGSFLWTRTTIIYTDETESTSYSVSKAGSKGATGIGVSNVVEQYYLSSSKTSQTGGSWTTTCPSYKSNYYYWTRSEITWTDGSTTYTTAILANGLNDSLGKASETAAELSEFSTNVTATLESLQSQVDGQIETHYYNYEPTLSNAPADSWTTDAEKEKHEGDLFYDKTTGLSYRFFYNEDNAEWEWTLIRDTEVSKALEAAEKAQDTADSKRRMFVSQPYAPYEIGDLWSDGTDLWRCKTDLAAGGTFSKSHWTLATNYTDDTVANNALDSANAKVSKVDIEYALGDDTTTAPTSGWSTDAPQWTEGKYMWQRTATYIGDATTPTYSQVTCIAGAKGTGIKSVTIEYQAGSSPTTKPTGTWQPSVVTTTEGQYLWTRTTTTYTDSSIDPSVSYSVSYHAVNAKGVKITSSAGQVFKKTKDATAFTPTSITLTATLSGGLSGYQWYKDGTAMSGKTSATLAVASSAPGVYKCVSGSYSDSMTLVQITDGSDGTSGTSYYTYIRYGTDANGSGMTTAPTSSTKYIGIYSGTASTAPTAAASYTWSKYAGEDGAKGDTGDAGEDGTSYYVWIKYADTTTPASSAMYDSPTGRIYVGIYSGTSSTAPTAYGSYKWSKIQGSDGTGYTILLSNESHTFPGSSTTAAAAATTSTEITAYKNTTQQSIKINTVGGTAPGTSSSAMTATGVTGLTCYVTNNSTTTPTLYFKSSTSMVSTSGRVAIAMTIDGKSFTKYFSYAIALKGATGNTGNGISTTTIKYQVTTSGTTTPPDSGWKNSIAEAGGASQGQYLWTQTTITYTDGTEKVSLTNSYQGKDGEQGLSITSIKNQYQASQYDENATDLTEAGWVDICPGYNSAKPYIWYRQYVTWTEGDPTKTTPVLLESLSDTTKQAYDAHAAMTSWAYANDKTYIQGAKIYTGTIGADQIAANAITASKIAANSITADKITISDFTNYADLNVNTASKWGWTVVDSSSVDTWFQKTTISRDNQISKYYTCKGGEKLRVTADINTTVFGQATNGGTATATARGVTIMIFAKTSAGTTSYLAGSRITNTSGSISNVITLPDNARQFAVYVQIEGYPTFSGILQVKRVQVLKMNTAELIVDGAITADKIAADAVTAEKINVENLSALNAKIGQWSISDGIYSNIPTLNGYLVASSGNICITWNDADTTEYAWAFNSYTRNGDNSSIVDFTDYWDVSDEKTYVVDIYSTSLDTSYSTTSRVSLARAAAQQTFNSSQIANMITFLQGYESRTDCIVAIHSCLGCDMTSALRAELVKFGGQSGVTWTDTIAWYGSAQIPGWDTVDYNNSTIHAYSFIGKAGLSAGQAKEDWALGRMGTSSASLPITLDGAGSFTENTSNNMYVGYNGINVNNNLFLSEDVLEFRDNGRFTGTMRVLLPDETYGTDPTTWEDVYTGMDGSILMTSVGRGNYIGWGFYDEYSETYSVLAYLQPDSSDTYNGTDAFGGNFMINGSLFVEGYGGVMSSAGYMTGEEFMGYCFAGEDTGSEESSNINGLNFSSYYWMTYDSSWNVKEREGGLMLGDWTYNTFCVSAMIKNWSQNSDTRTFSVRNSQNTVDLRVTSNAGVYHEALAGYGTAGWLIRIATGGGITVSTTSDARLKNDLGELPLDESLTILRETPLHNFTYKADEEQIINNGVIAQELRDVLINNNIGMRPYLIIESPEVDDDEVYNDIMRPEEESVYSIDYQKFTPILWSGWKYHDDTIANLEREISELKRIIKEIKGE